MTMNDLAGVIFLFSFMICGSAIIALIRRQWRTRAWRMVKISGLAALGGFILFASTLPIKDSAAKAQPNVATALVSEAVAPVQLVTSEPVPKVTTTKPADTSAPPPKALPLTKAERDLDLQVRLKDCRPGDAECLVYQKQFRDEYASAMKRGYTSQRNVAYMLEDRDSHSDHGVVRDWVSACAWRAVIMNSRHAEVDGSDRANLAFACRHLNQPGRVAASFMASDLMDKIYKRPLAAGFRLP